MTTHASKTYDFVQYDVSKNKRCKLSVEYHDILIKPDKNTYVIVLHTLLNMKTIQTVKERQLSKYNEARKHKYL